MTSPAGSPLQQWNPAWDAELEGLYTALYLLGYQHKANQVIECGKATVRYHCHHCGKDIDILLSCTHRLCPRCALKRSYRFIATHRPALDAIDNPKLLTLTFKSIPTLDRDDIDHFTTSFAKLRKQKPWKDTVTGGIAGLELTFTPQGWHPHYHALLDATYLSQTVYKRLWKRITGDSYIVYIQDAKTENAVYEVAKYIAKGSTFYQDHTVLYHYLQATRKRRFFTTFGSLYGSTYEDPDYTPKFGTPADQDPDAQPEWGIPQVYTCPLCHDNTISYIGKFYPDFWQKPAVQIPF